MAVKRVIIQQPNLGLDTFGSDPKFFGCFGNRLPPQQHIIWAGFLCQSFCRHHKLNTQVFDTLRWERKKEQKRKPEVRGGESEN